MANIMAPQRKNKHDKKTLNSPVKFYAVRRGHKPGIYFSWEECKPHVHAFPSACYRTFKTMDKARLFMAGSSQSKNKEIRKQEAEVHAKWGRIPRQMTTYTHPNRKCTPNGISNNNIELTLKVKSSNSSYSSSSLAAKAKGSYADCCKRSFNVPPSGPVSRIAIKPVFSVDYFTPEPGHIYIDGACLNNGSPNQRAGVGVFLGPTSPCNVSVRLPGEDQSSCRAEVYAANAALSVTASRLVSVFIFVIYVL